MLTDMLLKRLFVFVLLILLIEVSSGQGILEGTIKDSLSGQPLVGAHVLLQPLNKGVVSDYTGTFRFPKIHPGTYEIILTYIGFEDYSGKISIADNQTRKIEILLTPKPYLAEETIITGSRIEIARHTVPITVQSISREEIEQTEEYNVLPILSNRVPGLFVTERGVAGFGVSSGAAGMISIRGVGSNPNTGVLVLIDGHPQYMGIFGHPLPDIYTSSDAEQVEVIRGPASILYGSNAMGGAINIITRKQKYDGIQAEADLSYGSFNTLRYRAGLGFKKERFTIYGSYNHEQSDGHRENSEFKIDNGYLKSAYVLNSHLRITADASASLSKSTDPGPASHTDSSYLTQIHWVEMLRSKVSIALDNTFRNAEGSFKLFYNYGDNTIYDGFHSTDHNFGLMLFQSFHISKGNKLTAGYDYKNYGGLAENTEAMNGAGIIFGDTNVYETGGYIIDQQVILDKISLTAGFRFDYNKMFGPVWIPQFGATYYPDANLTLKANIAKGYRSPTIRELFLFPTANPNLNPESMWNYEAGIYKSFMARKIRLELTVFSSQGKDMITTSGVYPNIKNENTGSFTHYGVEFFGQYDINKDLSINTNYSWLHTDKPLVAAPGHKAFAEVNYRLGKIYFTLNGEFVNNLYTKVTSTTSRESYFLLNAKLKYSPHQIITLYLAGNNLLDEAYEINYDYPMPGITVVGGLNMTITPRKNLK